MSLPRKDMPGVRQDLMLESHVSKVVVGRKWRRLLDWLTKIISERGPTALEEGDFDVENKLSYDMAIAFVDSRGNMELGDSTVLSRLHLPFLHDVVDDGAISAATCLGSHS